MKNLIFLISLCFSTLALAQNPSEVTNATVFNGALDVSANYIRNGVGTGNLTMGIGTLNAAISKGTASVDKLDGLTSFICDASAQYGYCQWGTNTIQQGDRTGTCQAQATYKGDASLYQLQLLHTSATVGFANLTNQTDWAQAVITYPCAGSELPGIKLVQMTSGTAPAVNIGRIKYGKVRFSEVAQPTKFGSVYSASTASCEWTMASPSSSFAAFSADSDCPTATASGQASAPTTKIPAIRFASLPKGKYYIVARNMSFFAVDSGAENDIGGQFIFNDGTNNITGLNLRCIQSSFCSASEFSGEIEYTSDQSNIQIQIMARETLSSVTNAYVGGNAGSGGFEISVFRWPSQNEIAVRAESNAWYVDGNISGGNPSLGIGNVSTYTEITDSALTLTPATGSAPIGIMCSSTNAAANPSAAASTCSAGSESVGFNAVVPESGLYEVCFYASHAITVDQGETLNSIFQIIETPTNAQTLTQEGRTRVSSTLTGMSVSGGTNSSIHATPPNCSIFNLSAGTKGFRLMYEQSVSGTPNTSVLLADASSGQGQRDIRFTMRPWITSRPAINYVGSVTSNSSGAEKLERARVGGSATDQTVCSTSPCTIHRQSGSWLTSVTRSGTGAYALTYSGFTGIPSCGVTNAANGVTAANCQITSVTSTTLSVTCFRTDTSVVADHWFDISCQGPR